MGDKEKIYLLQLLLEDIRGNWGWEIHPRIPFARQLAKELNLQAHVKRIDDYDFSDGRHFRTYYHNGGYEGMDDMHGLHPTIRDKSDEFKKLVEDYITFPDSKFDDWDEYCEQE